MPGVGDPAAARRGEAAALQRGLQGGGAVLQRGAVRGPACRRRAAAVPRWGHWPLATALQVQIWIVCDVVIAECGCMVPDLTQCVAPGTSLTIEVDMIGLWL